MAALAFDVETGELIDLATALEQSSFEDLALKYADRPNAYCCAECLKIEQDLSDAQLASFRCKGLNTDSSFRRGGMRSILDHETGDYKKVPFRPAFVHTTRLLGEDGEPILRPCESDHSIHHGFCRWIAASGRGWLLGTGLDGDPPGTQSSRHVISVMARYIKDPGHREPDISVLWANTAEDAAELRRRFEAGESTIDWSLCVGLTAVEVQKSPISKPELIQRTKDHLKHFTDVRWVFTPGNRPRPAREWLAEQGIPAFIIEEEADKSRINKICELAPPKKKRTYDQARRSVACLRRVLLFWLAQGFDFPEALSRAKADLRELSQKGYAEALPLAERWLDQVYPSRRFEPKQIWLRHKQRQASAS